MDYPYRAFVFCPTTRKADGEALVNSYTAKTSGNTFNVPFHNGNANNPTHYGCGTVLNEAQRVIVQEALTPPAIPGLKGIIVDAEGTVVYSNIGGISNGNKKGASDVLTALGLSRTESAAP